MDDVEAWKTLAGSILKVSKKEDASDTTFQKLFTFPGLCPCKMLVMYFQQTVVNTVRCFLRKHIRSDKF